MAKRFQIKKAKPVMDSAFPVKLWLSFRLKDRSALMNHYHPIQVVGTQQAESIGQLPVLHADNRD